MAPDNKQSSDVEQASDIESHGETEGSNFPTDEEITKAAKRLAKKVNVEEKTFKAIVSLLYKRLDLTREDKPRLRKKKKLIMNAMKEVTATNKSKDDIETGQNDPSPEDTKNPDFKNDVPRDGVMASPPLSTKKHAKVSPLDLETGKEAVGQEEDDKEGQEDAEDGARKGVGCVDGCLRDSHGVLLCLTISLLTVPILWLAGVIDDVVCVLLLIVFGFCYVLSFCKSNSFEYLRNVVNTEGIMTYMDRMYQAAPEIIWTIQCYHNETHYRTVTRYDSNGRSYKTTESYTVRVNTHYACGNLKYAGWSDRSVPLDVAEIEKYAMTKVSVKKSWIADEGAAQQKADFINHNNRDTEYDFEETFTIDGYRHRYLGFTNIEDVPCLAHWSWFVLSHLTVVLALPYRMWLSSRTGKIRTEIIKEIHTIRGSEIPLAPRMSGTDDEMRILMVGIDAAGKTTILHKLKLGEVVTTIPTPGFNVETVAYQNISFTNWDLGGPYNIRPLWRHYYLNTQGLIFVVDSNDLGRIDAARDELHRMLIEEKLRGVCLLVLANKQDLPNSMSAAELTHKLGLHEISNFKWYIQACCATTGDGLYEGIDWLSSTIEKMPTNRVSFA